MVASAWVVQAWGGGCGGAVVREGDEGDDACSPLPSTVSVFPHLASLPPSLPRRTLLSPFYTTTPQVSRPHPLHLNL